MICRNAARLALAFLVAAQAHAQDAATAREAEALERARALPRPGSARVAEFWERQRAYNAESLARDIVGTYEGKAHGGNFQSIQSVDITFDFREDGTFTTNLKCLTTGRSESYGRMDATLSAGDAAPFSGAYRAVSPSQLILAAGAPVTTVSPSLRDGVLSFYHAPASVFVVLRKKGTEPPPDPGFTFADVAGVYHGAVVPLDPAKQPGALSTADFALTLTDIGTFVPAWTKPGTETSVYPYTYYRGFYAIDPNGLLLLAAGIGGNDYGLATPMPFFDWALDGATLHMTSFDSHGTAHLAVSLDRTAPNPGTTPQLSDLIRGSFRGSAFRVTPQNTIQELEGVTARFDSNGTLHTNWSDRLAEVDPPTDTAVYRVASPRHLLLGYTYEGAPGIVAEATTDFCLVGDALGFTSFTREAYFVLKRE